jgi:hypothetical protein
MKTETAPETSVFFTDNQLRWLLTKISLNHEDNAKEKYVNSYEQFYIYKLNKKGKPLSNQCTNRSNVPYGTALSKR